MCDAPNPSPTLHQPFTNPSPTLHQPFTNPLMASLFGHILASTAIGKTFFSKSSTWSVLVMAGFCAFAPDLDVIGMRMGIAYSSRWGHRGFTHSLFFAGIFGWALAFLFFRNRSNFKAIALLMILSTASHTLLDMLTNGGLGCAIWWPLSTDRHFFPVRPIAVSPLSVQAFFSRWGLQVLQSELFWIGIPALFMYGLVRAARR